MLFIATVLMMFVLQYYISEQKDKWCKNSIHMSSILWKVKIKRLELRSKLVKACDESKRWDTIHVKPVSVQQIAIRHKPYHEHPNIRLCAFSASKVCAKNTQDIKMLPTPFHHKPWNVNLFTLQGMLHVLWNTGWNKEGKENF